MGHTVKPSKLRIDPKKTAPLAKAKPPKTKAQLWSSSEMGDVFRRFLQDFAKIAQPLTELLKSRTLNSLSEFNEEKLASFETLKYTLLPPLAPRLPRLELPFTLDTDASEHQIKCALLQTHDDINRYLVGYRSRTLNDAERNFSTLEKECLVVVWAMQSLRPYLDRQL